MKKIISILSGLFLFASLNVSAGNFLLNEYSVVTIGDFIGTGGTHVAGSTFVGGNYTSSKKMDLGQKLEHNTGINALTVAGEIDAEFSTYRNNIVLNSEKNTVTATTNSNQVNINGTIIESYIDKVELTTGLDDIKADYKAQLEHSSQYFSTLETNSNLVTKNQNNKELTISNNDIAVFSLDDFNNIFNSTNQTIGLSGSSINDIDAIIINVSGKDLSITHSSNLNISDDIKSKVIWNFYEAESINLNAQKFVGALLAPYATVTQTGGNIDGSVGVFSLITGAEVNFPTNTDVNIITPPGSATEVPEPTTLMLMFIAIAGLIYKRKTLNV
jgi:choice-of-anchor A domain-containing protein